MKFYIYQVGNCFDVRVEGSEEDEYEVAGFEAIFTPTNGSNGIIGISFNDLISSKKFKFSWEISGEYHHRNGFNYFTLGWEIKDDKNNPFLIQIKGTGFSTQRFSEFICKTMSSFLSELYQFDSIEDYIKFKESKDSDLWKSLDFKDKLLLLADIIKLYDKYYQINPATNCVREFEKELKAKLPLLLKEFEV